MDVPPLSGDNPLDNQKMDAMPIMHSPSWLLFFFLTVTFLAGCAASQQERLPLSAPEAYSQKFGGGIDAVVTDGLEALRHGRTPEAITAFNRALTRMPKNAKLHMLAGIAYQADYQHGNPAARDLAETAYIVASQLDPSLWPAHLQLGWLYLEMGTPSRAQKSFARVVDLEPDNDEAAYGLAVASYYSRDLQSALGAIRLAHELQPEDRRITRAAVFIYAASGLSDEAHSARKVLASLNSDPRELAQVDRRMSQWQNIHASGSFRVARGPSEEPHDGGLDQPPNSSPAKQTSGSNTVTGVQAMAADWSDCQQRETASSDDSSDNDGDSDSYTNDENQGDETVALRPLPSPCNGRPMPRMVVIDAAIIRTEEYLTSSRGINLLDGLQVVFGWSNLISRSFADSTWSTTKERTFSYGLPTGGVTYALNIANASDLRNDVLAHPSLVALDRRPSKFFSGTNITIAVSGTFSDGDLEEKPVGVSLSVTPTFIDDNNLLLAVKASRSGVEEGTPGTFNQALQTNRSFVRTNVLMRLGQTLVLSGLTEKESLAGRSRTPLLGDTPLLQYLFSNGVTEEKQKAILIVLTPRPVEEQGGFASTDDVGNLPEELRKRLLQGLTLPPATRLAMQALASNRFIAQFRSGDIPIDNWQTSESTDRLLGKWSFLYY